MVFGTKHKILFLSLFLFAVMPFASHAATLRISPVTGAFPINSTFQASLFLDTQGDSVNALDIKISFPSDKLQVVSPSVGQSVIGVWTAPPTFDNVKGEIDFQGGIPKGLVTSEGLISTVTFRAKNLGDAIVRVSDGSSVFANDGKGTNVLIDTQNAAYHIILPPPLGPTVVSSTHPDQYKWYSNPNVALSWLNNLPVQGFSYVLNDSAVDNPDDISEGLGTSAVYKNLPDGTYYFHIKAIRDGNWGGVTNFAINIDSTPPADFPIDIVPSNRTVSRQPAIQFQTTDKTSGIDHYEIKLIPLNAEAANDSQSQPFFIDAQSPFIPSNPLALGTYDVIIRAYDAAGNFKEETTRFSIVPPLFKLVQEGGVVLNNSLTLTWPLVWGILLAIILFLAYLSWKIANWHRRLDLARAKKDLPQEVARELNELQEYRKKYGHMLVLLFIAGSLLLTMSLSTRATLAQESPAPSSQSAAAADNSKVLLSPPIITTFSKNISNQEIFYIGGKTDSPGEEVVIYLQNPSTGETLSESVTSDSSGNWFYRHSGFLSAGNYILWAETQAGSVKSPPSPQVTLTVNREALQFGASRLSYEAIYLFLLILLLLATAGLTAFIVFHLRRGKQKELTLRKEIAEAEESIRHGFALLKRDIAAELRSIHKNKLVRYLSADEKMKEERLMRDLAMIEKKIGKEVFDIERFLPR